MRLLYLVFVLFNLGRQLTLVVWEKAKVKAPLGLALLLSFLLLSGLAINLKPKISHAEKKSLLVSKKELKQIKAKLNLLTPSVKLDTRY